MKSATGALQSPSIYICLSSIFFYSNIRTGRPITNGRSSKKWPCTRTPTPRSDTETTSPRRQYARTYRCSHGSESSTLHTTPPPPARLRAGVLRIAGLQPGGGFFKFLSPFRARQLRGGGTAASGLPARGLSGPGAGGLLSEARTRELLWVVRRGRRVSSCFCERLCDSRASVTLLPPLGWPRLLSRLLGRSLGRLLSRLRSRLLSRLRSRLLRLVRPEILLPLYFGIGWRCL